MIQADVEVYSLVARQRVIVSQEWSVIHYQVQSDPGETRDLRIFIIISNGIRHPLFVRFLLREPGASSDTEDDR